jgi:hypothetical protein
LAGFSRPVGGGGPFGSGRVVMAALGVGKVVEGSGVARDGSDRYDSGRACGGAGAS